MWRWAWVTSLRARITICPAPRHTVATLRNAGDLAVSNPVVAFYDGQPNQRRVFITNISFQVARRRGNKHSQRTLGGARASNESRPACLADPAGTITEFDEAKQHAVLEHRRNGFGGVAGQSVAETNGAVR